MSVEHDAPAIRDRRLYHSLVIGPQPVPHPTISVTAKALLLTRVWITAVRVQFKRNRSLQQTVAALGDRKDRERVSPTLLSRAVWRGLRVGPWRPRCLTRCLVLYDLLRAQGDEPQLVIGLRQQSTSSDAHSWIELGGRDIGPPPGSRGYVELARYP